MAGAIEYYRDGQGNLLSGFQWDADPETAQLIQTWSQNCATLDRRGVMGVMTGHVRQHVGVGDWICMDAQRKLFIVTDGQMKGSYVEIEPPAEKVILP